MSQVSRDQVATIVLSGGVGGAKLALGFYHLLPDGQLTVITNTGDDFDLFGLRICPDTDTLLYTLAGLSDTERGWGRADETWSFMQTMQELGGEHWFQIGDKDLALHLLRSQRLQAGTSLTEVTEEIAKNMGIKANIWPMCEQQVATQVLIQEGKNEGKEQGKLAFQHYFVRLQCTPQVIGFEFDGLAQAQVNPKLQAQLKSGPESIIIAPSNPYVSIDPIIQIPDLFSQLKASAVPVIAVSPIVGEAAIKGPAAKMMSELGLSASALTVAHHYQGIIDGLVIDEQDAHLEKDITSLGMAVEVAPTVMHDLPSRIELARTCQTFARQLSTQK